VLLSEAACFSWCKMNNGIISEGDDVYTLDLDAINGTSSKSSVMFGIFQKCVVNLILKYRAVIYSSE